jgi:hypothetical protein
MCSVITRAVHTAYLVEENANTAANATYTHGTVLKLIRKVGVNDMMTNSKSISLNT